MSACPASPAVASGPSMQPHAPLLALVALLAFAHARSASIPQISSELEKKLAEVVEEAIKDQKPIEAELPIPAENLSSEPALIDQPNLVKDVDNNLRKVPVPEIPVKVIVDDVTSQLKSEADTTKNEIVPESDSVDVKRAEPDLEHPGAPQHQEHETQGPEHFEENHILSNIKDAIAETQTTFNQGFSVVTKNVQNFFLKNEQLSSVQESIQDFQDKFRGQIEKINLSIKTIMLPVSENVLKTEEKQIKLKHEIQGVESTLKNLENNFEKGINTISNGIQVLAAGKAEGEVEAKPPTQTVQPAPPATTEPSNIFSSFLNAWNSIVSGGIGNLTNTFNQQNQQNPADSNASSGGLFNLGNWINVGNPPAPAEGAQSDEAATNRPSLLQNLQLGFQSLLNPGQAQADSQQTNQHQPNRPLQTLQNNLAQSFSNFFQPNRQPAAEVVKPVQSAKPAKPAQPTSEVSKPEATADAVPQGSNVVPVQKPESDAQKPAEAVVPVQKPEAEAQKPAEVVGPIQQLNQQIQKNPIVRGITGAVQRLQHTISNSPDRPRDATSDEKAGKEDEAKSATEKGHKPGSGSSVDYSNSDSKRIEEQTKPKPEISSVTDASLHVQSLADQKDVAAESQKEKVAEVAQGPVVPTSQVIKTE